MADACRVKFLPLILTVTAAVLLALTWVPGLAPQKELLSGFALASTVLVIVVLILRLKGGTSGEKPAVSPVAASMPQPAPAATTGAEGLESVGLLSAFQENGRLIDFLMDDIAAFPDAQVGAAARIVHQGCRNVLDQSFEVVPASESAEGATISVPLKYRGDEYRLSGSLSGEPPFTGTIVHRGWKTAAVNLPQIVMPEEGLPNIAPTEVEISG